MASVFSVPPVLAPPAAAPQAGTSEPAEPAEPAGEKKPAEEPKTEEPAAPKAPTEPAVPPPEPVDEGKAPVTAPDAPETAAAPKPEASPEVPATAAAPATAVAPDAPAAPEVEAGVEAPAVPAIAPEVAGTAAPEALPAPAGIEAAPDAPSVAEAPAVATSPEAPAIPLAEAAPAATEPPEPPPLSPEEAAMLEELAKSGSAVVPESDAPPAPALETAEAPPEVTPEAAAPPAEETMPEVAEAPLAPEAPAEAAPAAQPETAEAQLEADPSLPAAEALPEATDGVTTGRLPKIGDAPAAEVAEVALDLPLVKYAQIFENPEGKPAFAIVLIDDGDAALDRAALAGLPFPVSFALDPNHPDAAKHAAIYRKAGQEVVLIATGLPKGAEASDVEIAMSAMAQSLAESVAVMDMPDPAFQGDRPLASLVVPVIGGQGRGLLTWDAGLNAADQVARREDVPAAVVFRDLDAGGETPQVIRRYLDRAAFKAAQEGKVTVVGRTRPETVAAILEWTVEGRAATVALAPLTAVLSAE